MIFNLREATMEDADILLHWRNDDDTRKWFFDENIVDRDIHVKYMNKLLTDDNITQCILLVDGIPAGTIKSTYCTRLDAFDLSYIIDNNFRGKKLGVIMMRLFSYGKTGKFICNTKCDNVPSINVALMSGFSFTSNNQVGYNTYQLTQ